MCCFRHVFGTGPSGQVNVVQMSTSSTVTKRMLGTKSTASCGLADGKCRTVSGHSQSALAVVAILVDDMTETCPSSKSSLA
ncbi:hypothetical protein IF1G_07454 [Cordyceps javanica]|uniref:Uncharacterized protein n=1 Tax=Cordyceps javanica TaxID=43265 RepID=A0A545UW82_9HYPO|nr:hypothetical protein IF1G_07454 [Cordyceps javanica]